MDPTRLSKILALLRGVILLLAGLFAVFAPESALSIILIVGGCLFVIDGILVLASQNYGVEQHWPFWLSVTRGLLSVVAGILVLSSFYLATVMPLRVIATLVGLQAVVVGLIEIIIVIRQRREYRTIWTPLLGALLYVAFGVALMFVPYASALVLVRIGGVILAAFAILQLVQTWMNIRNSPGVRPIA